MTSVWLVADWTSTDDDDSNCCLGRLLVLSEGLSFSFLLQMAAVVPEVMASLFEVVVDDGDGSATASKGVQYRTNCVSREVIGRRCKYYVHNTGSFVRSVPYVRQCQSGLLLLTSLS